MWCNLRCKKCGKRCETPSGTWRNFGRNEAAFSGSERAAERQAWGEGGPRGSRAAGGKTKIHCATVKVVFKKGVQHGKRSL